MLTQREALTRQALLLPAELLVTEPASVRVSHGHAAVVVPGPRAEGPLLPLLPARLQKGGGMPLWYNLL